MLSIKYYVAYILAIIAGFVFLYLGIAKKLPELPCILKNITGLSCPSCGMTTSIKYAFNLDLYNSFNAHPFGIHVIIGCIAIILFSAYGLIRRKRYSFTRKRFSTIAITIIIIYLLVWIFRLCA